MSILGKNDNDVSPAILRQRELSPGRDRDTVDSGAVHEWWNNGTATSQMTASPS